MTTFEEYLAESMKLSNDYAVHFLGKWYEDQVLPWEGVEDIAHDINGEKADISAISTWFMKHMRVSGGHAEILDISAKKAGTNTIEVDIRWKASNDHNPDHTKTTPIKISSK